MKFFVVFFSSISIHLKVYNCLLCRKLFPPSFRMYPIAVKSANKYLSTYVPVPVQYYDFRLNIIELKIVLFNVDKSFKENEQFSGREMMIFAYLFVCCFLLS